MYIFSGLMWIVGCAQDRDYESVIQSLAGEFQYLQFDWIEDKDTAILVVELQLLEHLSISCHLNIVLLKI